MIHTASWAWFPGTLWPGYQQGNQSNISAGQNGLQVSPCSYAGIVWQDADGDGRMADGDTGDASMSGEVVTIGDSVRTIQEIGKYLDSTVVVKGVTYHVAVTVWLFGDGTYMVRIADADIPHGVNHDKVESIKLGGWDGIEYSHSWVDTRDEAFVCFAAGTLIETAEGPRPVENLRAGDTVLTLDHGMQSVRWIGRRTVPGRGRSAPVTIAAGALSNRRDLVVSQQHRMLLSGWQAELFTGEAEVLVAALHLVDGGSIRLTPCESVTWEHVLFDAHEIVFAEGCPSESFHPGTIGLSQLGAAARHEILALFPELANSAHRTARPCLRAHEARSLAGAAMPGFRAQPWPEYPCAARTRRARWRSRISEG